MTNPSHVYIVDVVDRADFNSRLARVVCKTLKAAQSWGARTRDEYAQRAHNRGDDYIDIEYQTTCVNYLDN